jgi:transcriptional regulator with XRE-family HTH domain
VKTPRLREWREAMGETQATLSELAGVSEHTLSRIEHGASLRPSTARKIADALGVSVIDLMESPPTLAGAGKGSAPQPGRIEIELEQLHDDDIHSGHHDAARLADFLNGLPIADMNEDCQRFTRLVAFVLTTTEYLTDDQWRAVHEDMQRKLAPPGRVHSDG